MVASEFLKQLSQFASLRLEASEPDSEVSLCYVWFWLGQPIWLCIPPLPVPDRLHPRCHTCLHTGSTYHVEAQTLPLSGRNIPPLKEEVKLWVPL